jgi:hypothetical protein
VLFVNVQFVTITKETVEDEKIALLELSSNTQFVAVSRLEQSTAIPVLPENTQFVNIPEEVLIVVWE